MYTSKWIILIIKRQKKNRKKVMLNFVYRELRAQTEYTDLVVCAMHIYHFAPSIYFSHLSFKNSVNF